MGLRVEKIECAYCSGTTYCPSCLGTGSRLDYKSEWSDCTGCWSQEEGKCCYCHGKGYNEQVHKIEDEKDVNLDFNKDRDEDFEIER